MRKKLLLNVGMLTVSNVAVRVLGMLYRVWLSQSISAVALGIYQLAMSVYLVLITPVSSGLPSAVSRLSAIYQNKTVLKTALKIGSGAAFIIGLAMLCANGFAAKLILHEKSAYIVLLALIPASTVGALASLPAAFLHSCERSSLPAVFEIVEQLGKMAFGVLVISLFAGKGDCSDAALAALSVSFGGVISFIMLRIACGKLPQSGAHGREIVQNAAPLMFSRLATTLLHLGTSTLLPLRLMIFGLTQEGAMAQYGILSGMAYPVVFMPLTLTSAVCVVLLPNIAKTTEKSILLQKVKKALIVAALISAVFAVILYFAAPLLATDVFKQRVVGKYMRMLLPCVLFAGMTQVSATVLSGMGKQKAILRNNILDGAFGLVGMFILCAWLGIEGFIISNVLQDLFALIINGVSLKKALKER